MKETQGDGATSRAKAEYAECLTEFVRAAPRHTSRPVRHVPCKASFNKKPLKEALEGTVYMASRMKERLWASVRDVSGTNACGGCLLMRRTVKSTYCRRRKRSVR